MSKVIYIDGYDALKAMCANKDSKEIAHYLIHVDGIWRDKSLETGASRVRACLNKDKPEFFKLSELIAIAKFTKRYDAVNFMCDELGLSRPQPTSAEEQLGNISRSISDAAQVLAAATEQLSRIESNQAAEPQRPNVRAVNFSHECALP